MPIAKFSVYILKSLHTNYIYIGISSDVQKRLRNHNLGKVRSTKFYKPFSIIYQEEHVNAKEARKREKHFKSGVGRQIIKKWIMNNKVAELPAEGG